MHAGDYGTGYLVARGLVLTAKHVVTRPEEIRVRFLDSDDSHRGRLVWESAELDAVLIELATAHGANLGPVRWGLLASTRPGVPWEFAAFPQVQKLGGGKRAVEPFRGRLDPLAGAPHGIQLEVSHPGADIASPWRGVSGTAVTCHGLVTAIVTSTMPAYEHRRLLAVPAEQLLADPEFRRMLAAASGFDPLLEPADLVPMLTTPLQFATVPTSSLSPSSLLRADAETIAFHGRDEELRRLVEWCGGTGFSSRLLVGSGGYGKTRLARQLGHVMQEIGWVTGDVVPDVVQSLIYERLAGLRFPTLLTIDYAETRTPQVKELLAIAARHRGPEALRVLLIARTGGDWWQQLISEAPRELRNILTGTSIAEMTPLTAADRDVIFTNSVRGLAPHIEGKLPKKIHIPDLSADRFGSPLRIAMEALASLLAAVDRSASTALEDVILDHERPYWSIAAKANNVTLEPEEQRVAVAAATLCVAADETEALALLRRLDGLGDDSDDGHQRRRRVARWLRGLYPASATDAGSYWAPLQPDLLAEHLVAAVTRVDSTFVPRVLAGPSDAQAQHALRLLSHAACHHPHVSASLTKLISTRPDLVRHAIAVAPQTEEPTHLLSALDVVVDNIPLEPESVDLLWRMTEMFPARSVVLSALKLRVYQAIAAIHTETDVFRSVSNMESFAAAAANLSDQFAAAGRDQHALQGSQLAASFYGMFAEQYPDLFLPNLASVLASLAGMQAKAGRADNAAATIDRALEISERLAREDPAAHESLLAQTLREFAHLFPRSRTLDSLAAMRRAVDIYERRATEHPDTEPALAGALNDLFPLCVAAGQADDAATAARRAVSIYERLASENHDAYQPGLARSLHNLTVWYTQQRQFDQALGSAEKLVVILSGLTRHAPSQFGNEFMSAALTLGFLRVELAKPDAVTPLVSAVAFCLMGGVRVKHHSIPYQAAIFLRTIYREAPEEVAEVWQRLTQRRLPDWLTRKDIDFTEEVWFRYVVDCGMTDAIRPLAELLEKQGKLLEAERLYHNAAAAGDTVAMMRLATILRRRGQLDEAETLLRDASAAGDTDGMTDLAMLLMMQGDLAEAETIAYMAADFGNVRAMNVLGSIKLQQGRPADAEKWFRNAAMAGNAHAVNNLLSLLRVKAEAGEEALRDVQGVSWKIPED